MLENSYICSIANNVVSRLSNVEIVVICLKTRTFAVSQTTKRIKYIPTYQLWFAWKLVHLQYRKQPKIKSMLCCNSCDLLENSYICSIANNKSSGSFPLGKVVICLKTRTFAVSQTTRHRPIPVPRLLWFAWKLVHLQYRKQQVKR